MESEGKMSEQVKTVLVTLAANKPYLSEAELSSIFQKRFERTPQEKEVRFFQNIAEDYRTR
jgi:hypothetical protein